jgi:hypothetical protein
MDFSSLPQYRGQDDDTPAVDRDPLDRASLGESFVLVAAVVLALVAGSAVASLVVMLLVAAPAG